MPTPDDDLFQRLRKAREQRAGGATPAVAAAPAPSPLPPLPVPEVPLAGDENRVRESTERVMRQEAPSGAGPAIRELVGTGLMGTAGLIKSLVTEAPYVERETPAVAEAAGAIQRRAGQAGDFDALGARLRGGQPEGMGALQQHTQKFGFNLPVLQRADGSRGVDTSRYMRELYASHYARLGSEMPAAQRRAEAQRLAREDFVGAMAVGGRSLPWVTVDDDRVKSMIMSLPETWRPIAATLIPSTEVTQTGTTTRSALRSYRPLDLFGRLGGFTVTVAAPVTTRGELPIPTSLEQVRESITPGNVARAVVTGGADIGLSVLRQSADEKSVEALMGGVDIIDTQPALARAIRDRTGSDWSNALAWAAMVPIVLFEPDPLSLATAGGGKLVRAGAGTAKVTRGAQVADKLSEVATVARQAVMEGRFGDVVRQVGREAGMLVQNVVEHAVAVEMGESPSMTRAAGALEADAQRAAEALPRRQALLDEATERATTASEGLSAVSRQIGRYEELESALGGAVPAGRRAAQGYEAAAAKADEVQGRLEAAQDELRALEDDLLRRREARLGERSAEADAARLKAEELRQAHQRLLSQAPDGAKGKALREYQQQVRAADRLATKAEEAAARFGAPRGAIPKANLKDIEKIRAARGVVRGLEDARKAALVSMTRLANEAQRERLANELVRLRAAQARLDKVAKPPEREAMLVARTQERIAARERLAAATEKALRTAAESFRAYDQVKMMPELARPDIGPAMTMVENGAKIDGPALLAALERVYGSDAVKRFTARGTAAAQVLTKALQGGTLSYADLEELYGAADALRTFAKSEMKAPAAAAFAVFDELDRNPAAQVVTRRDWLSTGRAMVAQARAWLRPETEALLSDELVQVMRGHDETLAVMQRDLRDLKQASDNDSAWLASIFRYLDSNEPLRHVRGVTRANVAMQDIPFTMFRRWANGMLKVDENALGKTLDVVARMWIATGTDTGTDRAIPVLMKRARDILADDSVTTAESFAARMRQATLLPIKFEDGTVVRLSAQPSVKSIPKLAVAVMNGAAADRAFRAAVQAMWGGLKPEEALDAVNTLSREWANVKDAERAWRVLAGTGLPSLIRRVVDETGRELNYQLVRVGEEATGTLPVLPKALVDQVDAASKKFVNEMEPYSSRIPAAGMARQLVVWLKESMTSGLLIPGFGNFTANVLGDATQIFWTEGLGMALRTAPHATLALLPYGGRNLQDALSRMAARLKGPVLPALVEAVIDPHIGAVLAGDEGAMVTRSGQVLPYAMLRRELIERDVYSTFIKEELAVHRQFMPGLRGALGRHQENLNEFASQLSARQRVLLYLRLRSDGVDAVEAQRRTLAALYDWKHGVGAFEARWISSVFMFYRFWKASTIQAGNALIEPLVKPDEVIRTFGYGQTQRARAQINLARMMPAWVYDVMTDDERRTTKDEYNEVAAFALPTWMNNPAGSFVAGPTARAYYQSMEGRKAPFEGWTSLQPTAVSSVGFLLNTMSLMAGASAAAMSDDFAMSDDAFAQYLEGLWGLLGPQADVAELWLTAQSDPRGMVPINPGDEAVLGLAARMGAFRFGQDERGRTTAPANLVRFYRSFVPLLGTQVSPMLTQAFRAFGTQDTYAEGIAATAAAWTRVARRYPQNPDEQLGYQQRAQTAALRSISEQREQEARRTNR